MHFGFDQNHVRHAAICSGCRCHWGTCGCMSVYPMNPAGMPLVLEQTRMVNGSYFSGGQQMYCGGCGCFWGTCGCVGFQPMNQYREVIFFEDVMSEHFGMPFDNPALAMASVLANGGSIFQAEMAAQQAAVVRAEEEFVEIIDDGMLGNGPVEVVEVDGSYDDSFGEVVVIEEDGFF